MVLIGSLATPSGNSSCAREHALADRLGIEAGEFARVERQIPHDQLVLVRRVRRQRPHDSQAAALGRVHARDVQEGLRASDADLGVHRVLLRSLRQNSHSLGWRAFTSRASAIVARTSASASCAASCVMALAAVRCSSLNDGRPSACFGHSIPCGRSA